MKLSSAARKRLPSSAFADPAQRRLPIHDAKHARNAMARLSMMRHQRHVTAAEYDRLRARILAAYDRFGIERDNE